MESAPEVVFSLLPAEVREATLSVKPARRQVRGYIWRSL